LEPPKLFTTETVYAITNLRVHEGQTGAAARGSAGDLCEDHLIRRTRDGR
jgi:hypothetical protein